MDVAAVAAVAVLAAVPLLARRLRFLDAIPRSRWLSFAGGTSVAYVFVHLLPELAERQERFADRTGALAAVEHHAYLLALAGLAGFYGVERLTQESRARQRERGREHTEPGVFWLSLGSFSLLAALIGYALVAEERGPWTLALYTLALALHFVVVDHGLWEHHRDAYVHVGRWLLAGGVVAGAAVAAFAPVRAMILDVVLALLAGGIVLNVLKEELPEARRSRFSAFALGAASYATLLVLV